jgi:hypothetical protein
MPRPRAGLCRGRRFLAILVLYAFALQTVLGGMAMAAATGPEHVLCLAESGGADTKPDGKHLPAHGPLACCAVCHAAAPAALPAPAPAALAPPRLAALSPRARAGRRAIPRAPPRSGLGARAPPVV